MSTEFSRSQRVAEAIAHELASLISNEVKDPRIGFVTVTAVRVSPDLRHARVWVSVMGSEEERFMTMKGLKSATPYLRGELGRQVRMKYLPDLVFELDTGIEEADRLEQLLRQVHAHDAELGRGQGAE